MFIIEDVSLSEEIYLVATDLFISTRLTLFQYFVIIIFVVLTVWTLITIMFLIKKKVIGPIEELTIIINGEKSQQSVEKFIAKIQKKAVRNQRKILQ